jgi:hypothetical protein
MRKAFTTALAAALLLPLAVYAREPVQHNSIFPPWQHGENNDAAQRGLPFTISAGRYGCDRPQVPRPICAAHVAWQSRRYPCRHRPTRKAALVTQRRLLPHIEREFSRAEANCTLFGQHCAMCNVSIL